MKTEVLQAIKWVSQLSTRLPIHPLLFRLSDLYGMRRFQYKPLPDLPLELIFMIFSYLSQSDLFAALLVSKRFASVAVLYLYSIPTPNSINAITSLYKTLNTPNDTLYKYLDRINSIHLQHAQLPSMIRKLAKMFENQALSEIDISNQMNMEDRIVNQLLSSSKKIQRITLNATGVRTLQFLTHEPGHITTLKSLELAKCTNITNTGLRNIGIYCQSLVNLNLKGSFIDDQTMTVIVENCLKLKTLDISECAHLTDQSFIGLFLAPCAKFDALSLPIMIVTLNAVEIISNANRDIKMGLKSIKFSADALHPNKDQALSLFFSVFKSIQCLHFSHCNITDAIFSSISFYCDSLKEFIINYDHDSINNQTHVYSDNFAQHSLDKLCTKSVFVEGVERIEKSGIQLSGLSLQYCSPSLLSITTLSQVISQSLTNLNVSNCSLSIDDNQIQIIAQTCPSLLSLDLSSCWKVTDTIFTYLADIQRLKSLKLNSCFLITSNGIRRYINQANFLQDFSITVDPQNASISRIWHEYNLAYYFGLLSLGDTFNKLVDRDFAIQPHVEIIYIDDENENQDEEINTRTKPQFSCTLSPIDLLVLQQQYPHIFIHINLIQNQGPFQTSFKKWKKLLDDYPDRKLFVNDLFFKTRLSYQKSFRMNSKYQLEKDVKWRSVLCVCVWLKMNGWCTGLFGNIANFLIE